MCSPVLEVDLIGNQGQLSGLLPVLEVPSTTETAIPSHHLNPDWWGTKYSVFAIGLKGFELLVLLETLTDSWGWCQ